MLTCFHFNHLNRRIMEIAVLDYQTWTIKTIKNCPNWWGIGEVEKYLYEIIGYRRGDICYMYRDSNIRTMEEEYIPESSRKLYRLWRKLKEKHPGAMILYRTGDFYECYDEDAVKASRFLGITQTAYRKHVDGTGKPLKAAIFPHYELDTYLPKLIRAGERVAICYSPE